MCQSQSPGWLNELRESGKNAFSNLLQQIPGTKYLIFDPSLITPLDFFIGPGFMQANEVRKVHLNVPDDLPEPDPETKIFIFIIPPNPVATENIAEYLFHHPQENLSVRDRAEFHVVYIPRMTKLCEKHLAETEVIIHELPIYFYPLDSDLLSLELHNSFREVVDGDITSLHSAATALAELQDLTGDIPTVSGKGDAAKRVYDIMKQIMHREDCEEMAQMHKTDIPSQHKQANKVRAQINKLVLIDRSADLVSPFPTQLTYEGLIDEVFEPGPGLRCGRVILDDGKTPPRDVHLSSEEKLHQKLRIKSFDAVASEIRDEVMRLNAWETRLKDTNKTPGELREELKSLPLLDLDKQALGVHIEIARNIKKKIDEEMFAKILELEQMILVQNGVSGRYLEEIEDLVCAGEIPMNRILRVICLQSVVCGGLSLAVLENYKRLLLECYGYDCLLTLHQLSQAKLLSEPLTSHKRFNFSAIKRKMDLVMDVDPENPEDIAYVHMIYGPLSVKLVQKQEAEGGWNSIRDVLEMLPGDSFMKTDKSIVDKSKKRKANSKKVVMVFYLGGVTMAEIAALRFLSQREGSQVEYIVATTSIITGDFLLETLNNPLNLEPDYGYDQ